MLACVRAFLRLYCFVRTQARTSACDSGRASKVGESAPVRIVPSEASSASSERPRQAGQRIAPLRLAPILSRLL
eukprot:1699675-Pleurochrysis_carterae.AAC.2